MADSGGYWLNLAEAQKLTQATLVPGVIEENVRRGGLISLLPIAQAPGLSIDWVRESVERTAAMMSLGAELTWTDNVTYSKQSKTLAGMYDQTPLNKYVQSLYGTRNNYRAITLFGLRKGMIKKWEEQAIYGDLTYGTNEFDGIHAIGAEGSGDLNIDGGETAPSFMSLRKLDDAMKHGIDFYLMPYALVRQMAAYYQEGGHTAPSLVGSFVWAPSDAGKPVPFWNGKRIIASDYLVAEQANTGAGSDARAARTSGTNMYSIFAIKLGQVMQAEPGLTAAFGGDKNQLGEFFRLEIFDKLEKYDAEGFRMVAYPGLLNGSTMAVGRVYDVTDTLWTN